MSKGQKQGEAGKFVQMYALCCPDSGDVRYIGKAACAKKAMSVLRAMNDDQRDAFSARWAASGKYYPGKP